MRRHRFLFFLRFLILSRNAKRTKYARCFNDYNDVRDIPAYFHEVNSKIPIETSMTEFEKACAIAVYLRQNVKAGPAVSASSETTLKTMIERGGVCSDFAQVFNVFCLMNNILVREWHIVENLLRHTYGHALNEIYCNALNKWVAIDAHEQLCFQTGNNAPASVPELFMALRKDRPVSFVPLSDYRPPHPERVFKIFSKETIPYLLDRYHNKQIDYYLDKFSNLPAVAINGLLILVGWNYRFIFLLDDYRRQLFPFLFRK